MRNTKRETEFAFLKKLKLETLTLEELQAIVQKYFINANECKLHESEFIDVSILLDNRKSASLFFELCLVFVLSSVLDKPLLFLSFRTGNIKRHKLHDSGVYDIICDNSMLIVDQQNAEYKFVVSVDAAICHIVNAIDELPESIANILMKKYPKFTVADYFNSNGIGWYLNQYSALQDVVNDTVEELFKSANYRVKNGNKIKLLSSNDGGVKP